jgi:hypothetical protein
VKANTTALIVTAFMLLCYTISAQKSKGLDQKKGYLINNWFESPKESSGDTITFRLNPYIKGTGDNPAFEFSQIAFTNAGDFTIKYWRWCRMAPLMNEGKYTNDLNLLLDFGPSNCKNELVILELKTDKLKVLIKEQAN